LTIQGMARSEVRSQEDKSGGNRRAGVEFVIEEFDMPALDYAGPRVVGPDNYILINAPVNPNWEPIPGGEPSLEIYVEAANLDAAQAEAERLYKAMRKEGGLPPKAPRVIGLFEIGTPVPLWLFFFDEANAMLEQQRYEAAVVAAQVACEIEIRAAVEQAADAPEGSLARMAIDTPSSYSLRDRRALTVFTTALGVSPTSQSFWATYLDHVARRNNVLHNGARVIRDDAIASVTAAEDMVDWVQKARRSRTSGQA
jgi:hypothetical protein